jgi:hypothetical protein
VTSRGGGRDRTVKLGGEPGELAEQSGLGGVPVEVGLEALVSADPDAHPVSCCVEFLEEGVAVGLVKAGQRLELLGDLGPPVGVRACVERAVGGAAGGAVADDDGESGCGHDVGVLRPAGVLVEPRASGVQHIGDIAD